MLIPTRVNLHLVGKAFMPSAFGRDESLPYKGILRELRFFAKTLRRETPQGDTAVSAQNDGRIGKPLRWATIHLSVGAFFERPRATDGRPYDG